MVTKHHWEGIATSRLFCSSKNLYGNKTNNGKRRWMAGFCSSKNLYGNKTNSTHSDTTPKFCSSKNLYGNKTMIQLMKL